MSVKRCKAEFAEPLRFELGRRIKQRSVIVLWAVDPSALPPIADIRQCRWDVRFVPRADINHHLVSAVVIGLIRLFQFGGTLKSARHRLLHGSLQSAAASVI